MVTPTIPYYPITHDDGLGLIGALEEIKDAIILQKRGTVYGFHIDGNESDPSTKVTYIADAIGLIPAYMDYTNNNFNYGSWRNAFFMPRPCMLKYDGTVDYYLDPNDYTKKEDGVTSSDVANMNYGGNAMMEWGQNGKKIWYKIVPDESDNSSASVYIADYQADKDFYAWSFINNQGSMVDHFYTPIYNGSIDTNGRLRSISGISRNAGTTFADSTGYLCEFGNATQERTAARLNNPSSNIIWDTEVFSDIVLINLLLTLMGKSTDTQSVFGQGVTSGGQTGVISSGTGDALGLFYGYSNTTSVVKVFGMENYWGNLWHRFGGLVNSKGIIKYKLTHGVQDGSSNSDYVISTNANDYTGYLNGNDITNIEANGYVNKMFFNSDMFAPEEALGTSSTNYCDYVYVNNTQVDYASHGGASGNGAGCGAWYFNLSGTASAASWNISASPSCKPLS